MAKQLISADRKWVCSSSDPLETDNVAAGSEMYISDTGENYVFYDGAWFPDLRMQCAIESVQTFLAPAAAKRTIKSVEADDLGFVFEAKTTAPAETFALPLEAGGTYDFRVDWGDGSVNAITVWNHADVTHTYASAGTHEIKITGTITGWRFNAAGDCAKMYELKFWGPLRLLNTGSSFYGCTNLTITATDTLNLTGTTILNSIFRNCSSITTIPSITGWAFSSVTDLQIMFFGCTSFNQSLDGIDVSSVTITTYMFYGASVFNQNIDNLDFSSCTTWQSMFHGATVFEQSMSGVDITAATNMTDVLKFVTLNTVNYDALITSWSPQAKTVVANFSAGGSKYTGGGAVETARDAWIAKGWTISDNGVAP